MGTKRKYTVKAKGHFFVTSIAEWRTGEDLELLIRVMKTGGFNFSVIHVPLPPDAEYRIENFVPVVEGCTLLAEYKVA